jgi:uncharacterized protein
MGQIKLTFLSRFHKKPVDFYDLLAQHAEKTLEGMQELEAWIETGEEKHRVRVPEVERQADALRLDLQLKLGATFITPFDREDIFDLSIKLDEVINGAKAIVREMEAMDVQPRNESLEQFAIILLEGTRCLHNAFASLKSNPKDAGNQAFLARKSENRFVKVYRQATNELFAADDLKSILKTYEVYRYMLQTAQRIDSLGEKLIHVIVKNG